MLFDRIRSSVNLSQLVYYYTLVSLKSIPSRCSLYFTLGRDRQWSVIIASSCVISVLRGDFARTLGKILVENKATSTANPVSRDSALVKGMTKHSRAKSTMQCERCTPPSPGSAEFTHFTRTPSSLARDRNASPTVMERFAMGRSDSSFNAIAGAVGGFASGIVSCPLDVIKTKLQAQGGFRAHAGLSSTSGSVLYKGMLGTARVIWRDEGLRGMYRGLGPIILGYLSTWAVWFTVYGKSKAYLSRNNNNQLVVNIWSSLVAGASSTMATNPIWVVKTRLMLQNSTGATFNEARPPWHYRSTVDAVRKMYRTEGVLSFYSGLTPSLLGLTHVAVQFPAYEYLKTKFTGQGMGVQGDHGSHWFGILSASVLSKILASLATYPHEVIRTRLQTQQRSLPSSPVEYTAFTGALESSHRPSDMAAKAGKAAIPRYKGIVMTFKIILQEEGWRAFYAGMGTNMIRTVPAITTTLFTYEYVTKYLNYLRAEGNRKVTL